MNRAEGNALFVEELARASAEGGATDLPPTIAAAAEARLSTLPAGVRQVLRACAVFGERFWSGAVGQLVGSPLASRVSVHLDMLEQLEVVSAEPTSRFASEREYVFRHALVRDAAYAMLTDDDRLIGHALAAEWLEPRVKDAAVLARHYELGDRRADAARWHVVAAEDALAATDAAGVAKHVASAEACAASGELLGRARLAQADMSLWNGDAGSTLRASPLWRSVSSKIPGRRSRSSTSSSGRRQTARSRGLRVRSRGSVRRSSWCISESSREPTRSSRDARASPVPKVMPACSPGSATPRSTACTRAVSPFIRRVSYAGASCTSDSAIDAECSCRRAITS